MGNQTYQQRSNQDTRIPVSQRRTEGGKVLEDNRDAFNATPSLGAIKKTNPLTEQQPQLATMTQTSPTMAAQGALVESVNSSPYVIAQRRLDNLAGDSARQLKEELFPGKVESTQRVEVPAAPNNTGLPDQLKSGIESLSGLSMDNVKVHYNSAKPAQLNALAYAQGTDIHVGPGQEKHLPHEAWHVVQQAQGRVKPTMQMKDGQPVNNDKNLEAEADVMGEKALTKEVINQSLSKPSPPLQMVQVLQRVVINSDIEFGADAKLIVQGNTNPENKAASLNAMKNLNAIADPDLTANYQNGHMVAAMFGGSNNGDNIRVWSDNYEDIHTDLEKKVRYGNGGVAAPQANEKGTVTVTTTDQNNLFDNLTNALYARAQNELNSVQYWDQQNVPADPKKRMVSGLKGANVHKAVNAIPTSVRFKYDETTGGGRTLDVTSNAGFGQPAAGANAQDILNALGQYINQLVPAGDALPTAALVKLFGE